MNIPRWKYYLIYAALLVICAVWCHDCYAQSGPLAISRHKSYDVYYDMQAMSPLVVTYSVQLADFAGNAKISSRHFKKDTNLPRPWVKDADFEKSGYVRGHLCAAGFRDSNKDLMKDTYYCSNICPMTMVCNSGAWKRQEDFIRNKCSGGCAFRIAAVTVFRNCDTVRIGGHHVRVPGSFVRLCVCQVHKGEAYTMVAQNRDIGGGLEDVILEKIYSNFILDERAIAISYYYLQWPQLTSGKVLQGISQGFSSRYYNFPWINSLDAGTNVLQYVLQKEKSSALLTYEFGR